MYISAIGNKFYADGTVRAFPGNTIICFVDPNSTTYRLACWVQDQLRELPFAHKLACLPADSLHMTVIQLLTDAGRQAERWSSHLPLDMPLAETDDFFVKVVPSVPAPDNFRMAYSHLNLHGTVISIRLKPADAATGQAISAYRDAISQATGIRFPNHDTYPFHISLAYHLRDYTPEEQRQLEQLQQGVDDRMQKEFNIFQTGKPHLTFFDDMFQFFKLDERHKLQTR